VPEDQPAKPFAIGPSQAFACAAAPRPDRDHGGRAGGGSAVIALELRAIARALDGQIPVDNSSGRSHAA